MSEIQTTKIDGQEFVPYKDYKELKEWYENLIRANKKASEHIEELEEENENLNKQIEQLKKGVKAGTNIIERLEEENKKLKEKLEQIKETYIRFEDSEKGYNKGLGELDQLIMNR